MKNERIKRASLGFRFGLTYRVGSGRVGLGGRYTLVVSEPRFRRFWKKALNDFEKDFENGI